jgi:hypothetical protein
MGFLRGGIDADFDHFCVAGIYGNGELNGGGDDAGARLPRAYSRQLQLVGRRKRALPPISHCEPQAQAWAGWAGRCRSSNPKK